MAAMSMFMLSSCEGDDPDFVNPDQNVQRCVKPDYLIRRYMMSGEWFDNVPKKQSNWLQHLNWYRVRAFRWRMSRRRPTSCVPGDSNPS